MMKAALSIWRWTRPIFARFADRADPAVCSAPVEALTIVSQQDRTLSPFADGEVDGSGSARN
jgi:hypothetical protein